MNTFTIPFIDVATGAVQRLQGALESKPRLERLLLQLGWQVNLESSQLQAVRDTFGLGASFNAIKSLVEDLRYNRGESADLAEALITTIKEL